MGHLVDLDKPVLTEEELWEYLHYDEGLPITRRTIKHAVINRELVPYRLGGKNLFTKRSGLDWVSSRLQPEPGRPVRSRKAVAAQ